ncbi:MAG TPA: chorismate-binding protein [Candidatus Aquilonibacter sp.]|nr:chorismate-binding protein [Candidatus Aquilonibacter sp.]
MVLTVRFKDDDGWLEFSRPRAVLRASSRAQALAILDEADERRREGAWIAGLVCYEWAGSVIGIFDEPRRRRSFEPGPWSLSPLLPRVDQRRYHDDIAAIKRAIYDGDVYQVNYTTSFDLAFDGDAHALWHDVAASTQAAYQAMLVDGDRAILSWSPELFLRFDGRRLSARPMKGTATLDDTHALRTEKNQAEHVMIVDLLRNDLRRVCDGVTVRALRTVERYPTFATMTSTIEGTLREGITLGAIFDAAFPCGSITGAPKVAAMQAIERTERRAREAYCGSIGFLAPERTGWWNVAIRTAQFDGNVGRFDAGGGIVSDSDADDEWNEIAIKSSFLTPAAGAFALWETYGGDADDETVDAHARRLFESWSRLGGPLAFEDLSKRMRAARKPGMLVRTRAPLGARQPLEFAYEPLAAAAQPVAICISSQRVASTDPWLRIKSSWRPAHRRAWNEAVARGCFDALLQNEADALTEGSRTNLFVELDGTLYTPPVASGLLPGILRSRLLACGQAREREIHAGDLTRASALYIGNSARGLLRARLHNEESWEAIRPSIRS